MGKSNVRDVKSAGKIKDGDLPEDKELTRKKVLQKISDARTELVMLYPFYGLPWRIAVRPPRICAGLYLTLSLFSNLVWKSCSS